jgi:hypothetical protein
MKLSKKALKQINTRPIRLKLAIALNRSERWIEMSVINNKPNGILTTAAAIQVIKEETGLSDSEILESEAKQAA